jgi:hypothetical protein
MKLSLVLWVAATTAINGSPFICCKSSGLRTRRPSISNSSAVIKPMASPAAVAPGNIKIVFGKLGDWGVTAPPRGVIPMSSIAASC